ncbi:hypothetical protein E2C01_011596 [Portunus trituberculatus]|uniref:Uncharacterized protein n=1 Tax=Portunus trituberculatus TaxID=210409 RepID=A0A5B7DBK3_PORTR|nr:hypothetical protein [Portunus trituberculatus]
MGKGCRLGDGDAHDQNDGEENEDDDEGLLNIPTTHPSCPPSPPLPTTWLALNAPGKQLCGGQYLFALWSVGSQPPSFVPLWERPVTWDVYSWTEVDQHVWQLKTLKKLIK